MNNNPLIDDYISTKPDFAQVIMRYLRQLIHQAAPEIEEVIKWNQPCFEHHGLVCSFAAFKQHVNFGFFNAQQLDDPDRLLALSDNKKIGALKISTIDDLPSDEILIRYISAAIALNAAPKTSKKQVKRKDKSTLVIPDVLQNALNENEAAKTIFNHFSYTKQKDYIEWITSAKREVTKTSRLATAIEWIAAGKSRHWKYENC